MKPNTHSKTFARIAFVAAVVVISSYCTSNSPEETADKLSADEAYLVEKYAEVAEAHNVYSVNALKSESLFAALDSTIDTLRIANTIRALNRYPDRWLIVFQSIERKLATSSQGKD